MDKYKQNWVVVCSEWDVAKTMISNIENSSDKEILRRIIGKYELRTDFSDGTQLRWIQTSCSARGYRFGKLWCDKEINKVVLEQVILPMYFGEIEDIVWF